jgi:hypothetical protein
VEWLNSYRKEAERRFVLMANAFRRNKIREAKQAKIDIEKGKNKEIIGKQKGRIKEWKD